MIIDLFNWKGKEKISVESLYLTLSFLEKKLASSPSFHVLGQNWSLADIYSFTLASEINDLSGCGFPRLQNFVDSFQSMMI